jgi:hypothetical protein
MMSSRVMASGAGMRRLAGTVMQTSNAYPELTEIKIDGAQINEPEINGAARLSSTRPR